MSIKKINLSPEKKARLRRDVLDALKKDSPAPKKLKPIKKPTKIVKAIKTEIKKTKPLSATISKPIVTKPTPPTKKLKPIKKPINPSQNIRPKKIQISKVIKEQKNKINKILPVQNKNNKLKLINAPKNKKGIIIKIILLVVIIAAIGLVIDLLGIYNFSWHDRFSITIANTLNLSAGSVNGQSLTMVDYLDDLYFLSAALAQDREGIENQPLTEDSDSLKERIFSRLISIALIRQELEKYDKEINNVEIEKQMEIILDQFSNIDEAQTAIFDIYKVNINQFKEKILKPILEKEALQELVAQDESISINQTAKERAEEVLVMAQNTQANFSQLANQFTEDETGINIGGDLGWVSTGELSPELEEILFSIDNGVVYDQLIKNRFGYHIVKVEKKLTNPDDGSQSVKARHILIRVNVDEYLRQIRNSAVVKKYVR